MAVETFRQDENSITEKKSVIMKRIMGYMLPYRWQLVAAMVMMMVTSLLAIFFPKVTQYAIDVAMAEGSVEKLTWCCLVGAAGITLWWILTVWMRKIMSRSTNEMVWTIRDDAFRHMETLSLHYFDSRPSGKILSRIVSDVQSLKVMFNQIATRVIPNIVMIIGLLIIMLSSNWVLTLASIIVVPCFTMAGIYIGKRAYTLWENFRKKKSNLNAFLYENYSGIRVVQSFNAEDESIDTFDDTYKGFMDTFIKAVKWSDHMVIIWALSMGAGQVLLYTLAYGVLHVGPGSIGELVAFTTYTSLFWTPVRNLVTTYNMLMQNITAAGRVLELMDTPSTLKEKENAVDFDITKGEVKFEHVDFAYPDEPERLILKDLSFVAEPGKKIALVGETGAGKTTIINLLARFYDTVSGRILIDGMDISDMTFESLRTSIAVMTQEPFLFSGTIRENLLYGIEDTEEEKMKEAARLLGAEEFILKEKDGYDTVITSQSFSHGQRQLIALVRTLLTDPKILILDEATSAIDTHTELLIQRGIEMIMKGRTSFVVAHRLSTIRDADEIFVVQNQGIAEKGNHDQLLQKEGGIYRELYEAQFRE